MDEQSGLCVDIDRLRSHINEYPLRLADGSTASQSSLKRRRELQQELEQALHRQAEVEELARVNEVTRRAVESGFVQSPKLVLNLGECPLCLEEIPERSLRDYQTFRLYPCCGVTCCAPCAEDHDERYESETDALIAAENRGDVLKARAHYMECERLMKCPFCRRTMPSREDMAYEMELVQAKLGRVWAQTSVGNRLRSGSGVKRDGIQAIHWLTLAAQQGDLDAQTGLGKVWLEGADVPISNDKALEFLLPAARKGHAVAQYLCGNILSGKARTSEEALMWFTLSAAQGNPTGQWAMGDLFDFGKYGMPQAPFKSLYWFKIASLQGDGSCQARMSLKLEIVKKSLFDGRHNIVGYSAEPEIHFWTQLVFDDMERHGFAVDRELEYSVEKCGCCRSRAGRGGGGSGSAEIVIKRCVQCKSIGYCSKECQVKHWKMGHKTDCKRVVELEKALKKNNAIRGKSKRRR
jgi:TPR repeat protein